MLARTQDEIVDRIKERRDDDFFGFETEDLAMYLDREHVKFLLKDDADPNEWEQIATDPLEKIKDYMPFAWDKANGERGLSAGRSIVHMATWLWLAGEDDLAAWADDESNYYHYGKPILERICEHLDIDWRALDNGERVN